MKKKSYCTQNEGDCKTCSLVNYGRDCNNIPVKITEHFHIMDDLLSGITYEELIITLQANGTKLTKAEIEKVFKDLLHRRIQDAQDNFQENLHKIIENA